jgi:hypothetical protein
MSGTSGHEIPSAPSGLTSGSAGCRGLAPPAKSFRPFGPVQALVGQGAWARWSPCRGVSHLLAGGFPRAHGQAFSALRACPGAGEAGGLGPAESVQGPFPSTRRRLALRPLAGLFGRSGLSSRWWGRGLGAGGIRAGAYPIYSPEACPAPGQVFSPLRACWGGTMIGIGRETFRVIACRGLAPGAGRAGTSSL